jgi:propanediol dehydratase large subunit
MSVVDDLLKSVESNLSEIFKTEGDELKNIIIKGTSDFVKSQKDDLERYTQEFISKKIGQDDLEDLLKGKKDLLEMHGLTELGLSEVKAQEIKDKVFQVITNSIISLL